MNTFLSPFLEMLTVSSKPDRSDMPGNASIPRCAHTEHISGTVCVENQRTEVERLKGYHAFYSCLVDKSSTAEKCKCNEGSDQKQHTRTQLSEASSPVTSRL